MGFSHMQMADNSISTGKVSATLENKTIATTKRDAAASSGYVSLTEDLLKLKRKTKKGCQQTPIASDVKVLKAK